MQVANQEIMYPATELVCFSKDKNGELRYDGLMKTANVTENTYTREIKELTGEEYLAVDKSNMPDKMDVLHTAQMLELYKSVKDYEEEDERFHRRENWRNFATDKELEIRNSVTNKSNNRGYLLKSEPPILLKFDRKTRCCDDCGIPAAEATVWSFIQGPDKYGNMLDMGLSEHCFTCEMKRIMGDKDIWKNM
jgi:hypothetical protein